MTTIAYKEGILAADSSIWGDNTLHYRTKKIFRLKSGALLGLWGGWADCMKLLEYLSTENMELAPPTCKDAKAILIKPNGRMFNYEGLTIIPIVRTKFTAGGSGSAVALGAMYVGASAMEAIKAAVELDTNTRGPIVSLKLKRE